MKRRDFLRGTLVTAGVVSVGPIGCGDDGTTDPAPRELEAGEAYFPQSVASGDPSSSTVILWARVWDAAVTGDYSVELEVAMDEAFEEPMDLSDAASKLVAMEAHDHCVKVRLEELEAQTTYWYRFVYAAASGDYWVSRTGRTKTAPAADADSPVRFAFVSCQDFNGHYYNTYARLLELDSIDFFVHLGDYVYETTGNPSFQDVTSDRRVSFTDTEGAISFGEDYQAAKSLSNYRELYHQYRSDRQLQRVHERYPIVAVWDDHEFSDDCHGFTATYYDGEQDEADLDRRRAATRAWTEHMPVDYRAGPDFVYDDSASFPEDVEIWRDLTFGQHLHLVMTDLRTRRVDHLVPEDAYPGAVLIGQAELEAGGGVPELAREYVDIDAFEGGKYADFLKARAVAAEWPESDVTGSISVLWINGQIESHNETADEAMDPIALDPARERGIAVHMMGKRSKWSSLGSRYLVVKDAYDAWSRVRYEESGGASEEMMGEKQRTWFLETMKGSDRTWKVWGTEFLLTQLIADLSTISSLGEAFAQRFYINCDDWTNQPNRRDAIIEELSPLSNVVSIVGDIHAFFASTPTSRNDGTSRIVELCTAGISSNSLKTLLLRTAQADPTLPPTAVALAAGAKSLLTDKFSKPNPDLAFAEPEVQGFAVVDVTADTLRCEFHGIAENQVGIDLGDNPGEGPFFVERFEIRSGEKAVYREVAGEYKRWDAEAWDWV